MPMRLRSRQTAWFIIIAGEESGVYEGMRWDGWDERAKPFKVQLGNIFGASYVTEMSGSDKRMGTDSDIDVGVETCRVMIRGGEGTYPSPIPIISSAAPACQESCERAEKPADT